MKKTMVLGLAGLSMLGLTVPLSAGAAAPSQYETVQIAVSYADLNIQSEAGARVLYGRLRRASDSVCGLQMARKSRLSLSEVTEARQCFRQTLAEAVAAIDSDVLKEIHAS